MSLIDFFSDPETDSSVVDERRTELGLTSYLPYAYLATPTTVMMDYDGLGAMFEVTYADTSTMSRTQRVDHCKWLARSANSVGKRVYGTEGWMAHTYAIRCEAPPLSLPSFVESDGRRVLAESHIAHMTGNRGRWRHFLAFTYLPPAEQQKWLAKLLVTGEPEVESSFDQVQAKFESGLEAFTENMLGARLRRLGTHPDDPRRNELLEAMFLAIYGEEQAIYVGHPFEAGAIGGLLAARDIIPGRRPKVASKHMRVLSVFGYPSKTRPDMLDAFLQSPIPDSRFSTRLVLESTEKAAKKLDADRRAHAFGKFSFLAMVTNPQGYQSTRVNRAAEHKEEQSERAIFANSFGRVSYGHLSANVVLFADTLPEIEDKIQSARKALTGFTVNVEDFNTMQAYFGSLPFDKNRSREGKVHTGNAARIWASSSAWPGRKTWACKFCGPKAQASFIALTRTGEDFHIDTHDGDNRSFLLIGKMGTGKSTLLNKMMAEDISSENHLVFGCDKNRGMLVTTRFLGGEYREARRFWLFANLEQSKKRDYLTRFLSNLIEMNVRESRVNRDIVKLALERMLIDKPRNRNLGTFMSAFGPSDLSEKKAFTGIIRDYAIGGVHGGVFDGEYDPTENTGQRVVYELGHFMTGNQDDRIAAPVMLWLLHAFGDRYPGHSSKVYCDEWWAMMKKEIVAAEIDEELRTMRHRHAGMGFATHSFADIAGSPIASTVMAACPTRFIMPDSDATGYGARFLGEEGLQFTEPQILAIRDGVPKVECAMATTNGFAMFRPSLSPAEAAIFGCTGKDEIDAAVALMESDPENWRYRLLMAAGCEKEANRIRDLSAACNTYPLSLRKALSA